MGRLGRTVALGFALATATAAGCEGLTTVEERYTPEEIGAYIASLSPNGVVDYAFANGTTSAGYETTSRHNLNNTNTCLFRTEFDPTRPNQPGASVQLIDGIYVVTNTAGQHGYYEEDGVQKSIETLYLTDNGPDLPPTPADEATAAYMAYQHCNFDPYRE